MYLILGAGHLSKLIIELVPGTRETFEQHAEGYCLFWLTYFYDETLKALRQELLEDSNMVRDTQSATRLAMDSRQAQINLHSLLQRNGLPDTLVKSESEQEQEQEQEQA